MTLFPSSVLGIQPTFSAQSTAGEARLWALLLE